MDTLLCCNFLIIIQLNTKIRFPMNTFVRLSYLQMTKNTPNDTKQYYRTYNGLSPGLTHREIFFKSFNPTKFGL